MELVLDRKDGTWLGPSPAAALGESGLRSRSQLTPIWEESDTVQLDGAPPHPHSPAFGGELFRHSVLNDWLPKCCEDRSATDK